MFRYDIKTFERETVSQAKNRQNIVLEFGGGQETNQETVLSRNDQNEKRTDYEGKVGFTHRYTKAQQSTSPKISSFRSKKTITNCKRKSSLKGLKPQEPMPKLRIFTIPASKKIEQGMGKKVKIPLYFPKCFGLVQIFCARPKIYLHF